MPKQARFKKSGTTGTVGELPQALRRTVSRKTKELSPVDGLLASVVTMKLVNVKLFSMKLVNMKLVNIKQFNVKFIKVKLVNIKQFFGCHEISKQRAPAQTSKHEIIKYETIKHEINQHKQLKGKGKL